jgi:hypothetical protein
MQQSAHKAERVTISLRDFYAPVALIMQKSYRWIGRLRNRYFRMCTDRPGNGAAL